jgi:histone-lysine N-methyltransferase SETMAR
MWTEYDQKVKQQCYLEVLTRLQESVRKKRAKLWPEKWILHHDNALAHDALRVHKFLAKKPVTKMDHPFNSPDLTPCNFWLFPKLKNAMNGQRFYDIPDIHIYIHT